MRKYKLAKLARSDLKEISHYTQAKFGTTQRRKYIKILDEAFSNICQNPKLGRQREDFASYLLFYPCQKHFIIYRKKSRVIEIIRVLNMNMDVKRHLYAFTGH